jgi:hypothetical protein
MELEDVRAVPVDLRQRPNAIVREKFSWIQEVIQCSHEPLSGWNGKKPMMVGLFRFQGFHTGDDMSQILPVFEKPVHPFVEPW